jgi:phage terminase small subunit
MALSLRHARFVAAYIKSGNATQSYIDAGYDVSPSVAGQSGYQLLKKPQIKAAIDHARAAAAKDAGISTAWVLDNLVAIFKRCSEPGDTFHPTGAIRALELIGKQHGMFVDRLKISEEADLSDDELSARLAAFARREAATPAAAH